ncbi:extracellular solute-binding protein family 1 [Beutenbergia cavernae DSM 12333]|uniref:Extracellular solute-binding protein family 1 n=1 Tax=Beutenbergia cavernae (strain ATCC BAA-8 / DSM 12333 / CCUG 43141 / JCM 11478 / NBRC 16432 / NCIMB 13614 / HKI 0122) TaxID=471853 RepID=C5C542_BEUC1|nr:extracellular solute-binding protein [Beutenbergia cavernae]ACQ82182.1 extracellular solute-binding protein family 1 [Beutenbergia cavernae DSM 12333]
MKRTRRARTTWRLAAAAAGGALLLSGCNLVGGDPGSDDDSTAEGDGEEVTLTAAIVPDPPGASEFYRAQFDLFEEANPGITVDVIENPSDQQLNAIELMFQQGESPDVFRAQGTEAMNRFYDRGWLAPLDELETDEFIARFPEGSMDPAVSGLHREDHLVSLPLVWGDWGQTNLLIYNADILAENGFDGPPETWSEYEEMARTITENGGGDVFGTAPAGPNGGSISMFANTAAPSSVGTGIDLTTGEPSYTNPQVVELVEQWRGMQADGVFQPGWESWDGARAFSEFAAGRLAMYASATWHVAEIRKLDPEIAMELAPIPVPDSGRVAYSPRSVAQQPIWSMSAESEHPEEALKLMDFLASIDFYAAYYEEFGSFTASMQAWEDAARENPDQAGILDVAEETIRTSPNPQLAGEGAEEFWAAASANPDLKWGLAADESIINNSEYLPIAEARTQAMEALIAEYEADDPELREQLAFEDWDPLTDYAPAAE